MKIPLSRESPQSVTARMWSDEEVRSAVRWLLNDAASPWRQAKGELARLLGFRGKTPTASLKGLTRRAWIYPNQRGHLSRTLARVMAGELVPVIPENPTARRSTKVADYPIAIGPRPPVRLRASLSGAGVTLSPMAPRSAEPDAAPFPSLRQAFALVGRPVDRLRGVPGDAVRPTIFRTLPGVVGGVPKRR